MGIVTWASVRVQLIPDPKKTLFVTAAKLDDLVDLSRRLTRLRLGDELLIVNGAYLAALLGADSVEAAALREALPAWTLVIGIGGRALARPISAWPWREQDIAAEVAARGLRLQPALPGVASSRVDAVLGGRRRRARTGSCAPRAAWPTSSSTPAWTTLRAIWPPCCDAAAAHKYPLADVGVYLQPQHQGVAYHMEFSLPYAANDKADAAKARALYSAASRRLMAEGAAYFSRPYGEWADAVYNRDAAARDILRAVKKILDPNNILNPSKLCF